MAASIWEPLVGIGTLVLALATFALVIATFRLGQQGAAEVRAQWRPVLLARASLPYVGELDYQGEALFVPVINVGRGPALNVQAELDGLDIPGPGWGSPRDYEPVSGAMGSRRAVAIAPNEEMSFKWTGLSKDRSEALDGRFTYTDLAGFGFTTTFRIRSKPSGTELVGQSVDEQEIDEPAWKLIPESFRTPSRG